jgi:catechol 2,3-dioxygenase-like lactoylglutathione lyase family enzyme
MTDDTGPLGTIDLAATTLYANDLDAAVAWYDDKLGLTPINISKDGHPFAVFRIGGTLVVLEPIEAALEPSPPGAESTTINLVTKRNADEIRGELIANGVGCGEIVESPNFRSFLIRDLDGNRYYVAQGR